MLAAMAFSGLSTPPAWIDQSAEAKAISSDAMPIFGAGDWAGPEERSTSAPPPQVIQASIRTAQAIDRLPLATRTEWAYLTLTIYGEARGLDAQGKQAVANVIMNRLRSGRWGRTIRDVVTKSRQNDAGRVVYQFSCWGDDNKREMERMFANDQAYMALLAKDPEAAEKFARSLSRNSDWKAFQEAKKIAWDVMNGKADDITRGANHYHAGSVSPRWVSAMTPTVRASIGGHFFYTDGRS